MENAKNFLLSKTIIGLLVLVLNKVFKIEIENDLLQSVITNALDLVGAFLVIFGRVTAQKSLKLF